MKDNESNLLQLHFFFLGILIAFFLFRPPVLMLWDRVTGPDEERSSIRNQLVPDLGKLGSTVDVGSPAGVIIEPPALPISVSQPGLPDRWVSFQSSPDMLALSSRIAELTNEERRASGLKPLALDPKLSEVAASHSKDMVDQDYMAHVSKDGDGPSQRVGRLHRTLFGGVSENVASNESPPPGTEALAQQFVSQWMNSLGHRRNILRDTSTHIGVGCFEKETTNGYTERKCTQLFTNARAYAAKPLGDSVPGGSLVKVLIDPDNVVGGQTPTAVEQFDLATDAPVKNGQVARLTPDGTGLLSAELLVSGPPGVYSVSLRVPDADVASNRYWIIPGPYIMVQ